MDAIVAMRIAILSPVAMVVIASAVVAVVKACGLRKAKVSTLISMSVAFAAGGAAVALAYTVGWMVWYTYTTGYSAGNAPLAWIFFYGPASAAVGQLLALIVWWFRKPPQVTANAA